MALTGSRGEALKVTAGQLVNELVAKIQALDCSDEERAAVYDILASEASGRISMLNRKARIAGDGHPLPDRSREAVDLDRPAGIPPEHADVPRAGLTEKDKLAHQAAVQAGAIPGVDMSKESTGVNVKK
jgi:hypothetical protein